MTAAIVNSLTSVVIGLESCNILLFVLLVITPAPKHAMVRGLIISCLCRSILDIILPIAFKVAPDELSPDGIENSSSMISLCVADSILLRYVTVVKAAYAVSFTLPCLYLMMVQVRPKRSADDYPRLTKAYVNGLCVGPFVWALPVLVTPIPTIIRRRGPVSVIFNITSCYFDDPAFSIVSLVFTLVPQVAAVAITAIMVVVVWRNSDTMLDRSGWIFVKTRRFARFGTLVLVTMASAVLYAAVLAGWIHNHRVVSGEPIKWANKAWVLPVRASVIWEAITPLIFFVIFAAQEEIYEKWLEWLSRFITIPRGKNGGHWEESLQISQHTRNTRISHGDLPAAAPVAQPPGRISGQKTRPSIPGKILTRPLSGTLALQSTFGEWRSGQRRSTSSRGGLSPAPRPGLIGAKAADDAVRMSRYRLPVFKGPVLRTFGSQVSAGSRPATSSGEPLGGEDSPLPPNAMENTERVPTRDGFRPETPGSSKTFGRPSTAKR